MKNIKFLIVLLRNMGFRYLLFRMGYYFIKRVGLFKILFPTNPKDIKVIPVEVWKKQMPPFFFYGKNPPALKKKRSERLSILHTEFNNDIYTYFGEAKFHLGSGDWLTNPISKHRYDIDKHWSVINDMSNSNGDIKFVWEKARFSFVFDLIRYDFHNDHDCAGLVFDKIASFIDMNPINKGPNYICSQEISLRVITWSFALYYYKDSILLTDKLFHKIMNSVYWQIHHVYRNINFSRIAVRNNHAIAETLILYLSNLLFPFLPNVKHWSKVGKKWFEQEINYQIYEDGTYLQFSNNYHRVVVQLLSFGIRLADLNGEKFNPVVYFKAKKSLDFLYNSMDPYTGQLPNYGANDGALFFKLNDHKFRDFRPQLQALAYILNANDSYPFDNVTFEDINWLGFDKTSEMKTLFKKEEGILAYPVGGFYIIRDNDTLSFIRCGRHKDRPSQADNLHIDIWYKGINYFRDNGSFMYNTEKDMLMFFMGTLSHNTIMLDNFDQMKKGPRFMWYDWSQSLSADLEDHGLFYKFIGLISAFEYLGAGIQHKRIVVKHKGVPRWTIEDEILGTSEYNLNQLWHFNPQTEDNIIIKAMDISGRSLQKQVKQGWYSSCYGVKEKSGYWMFTTDKRKIITEIELKATQ